MFRETDCFTDRIGKFQNFFQLITVGESKVFQVWQTVLRDCSPCPGANWKCNWDDHERAF